MKPYSEHGRLSVKQQMFNYRLSRARMVVECAFGRLKGRWRSLLKRNDINVRFLPTYVATCCVLHNICEIHKDDFNDDWMIEQQGDSSQTRQAAQPSNINSTAMANTIREALSDYFRA